jgi:hypothetical protein
MSSVFVDHSSDKSCHHFDRDTRNRRHAAQRVVAHPDHFYQQFFAVTLQDGGGGTGRAHLEEALRLTQASPFTVFEQTLPLKTTE